jgi:acyl-CoA reductase-like NAD-dependent aldehyde dehydrogenase
MQDAATGLKSFKTYINGEWVDAKSGQTFQSTDPYTAEPWAEIPRCGAEDVDAAVKAAWAAFDSGPWAKMTQTARGRTLRKIAELIEKNADYSGRDRSPRQRQANF